MAVDGKVGEKVGVGVEMGRAVAVLVALGVGVAEDTGGWVAVSVGGSLATGAAVAVSEAVGERSSEFSEAAVCGRTLPFFPPGSGTAWLAWVARSIVWA